MKRRELGRTGQQVSEICLGTMTWGQQNTEAQGHEQMDYAVSMDINFFDTAEMYAVPPKPETQGSTERIIGSWFKQNGNRDKIILATKAAGRAPFTWLREDGAKTEHTKEQLNEAVNASLKRLQTDYIDLYQLHWPDRPINSFGGPPGGGYIHYGDETNKIAEVLETLGDIVKSGKVRWIGLSNESAWGTMKFLHHSEIDALPRVQSIQNAYNLLNRTFEVGLAEVAMRDQVGLLAYSPLAQGFLTGKYQKGALPQGSRKQLFDRLQRYEWEGVEAIIDKYLAVAKKWNLDPSQMANQFVTTRPFVTSNIIGATTMEQLKLAVTSVDLSIDEELEKELNAVHYALPNPCP